MTASLGLAIGGGAVAADKWLSKNIEGLKDWDNAAKSLWHTEPLTSPHTGKILQLSTQAV